MTEKDLIGSYIYPAQLAKMVESYAEQPGLPRDVIFITFGGINYPHPPNTNILKLVDYSQLAEWFEAVLNWNEEYVKSLLKGWSVFHPSGQVGDIKILIKELSEIMASAIIRYENNPRRSFQIVASLPGYSMNAIFPGLARSDQQEKVDTYSFGRVINLAIGSELVAESFVEHFYRNVITDQFLTKLESKGWLINQPMFIYNPTPGGRWTPLELVLNRVPRDEPDGMTWRYVNYEITEPYRPKLDLELINSMLKHGADANLIPDLLTKLDKDPLADQIITLLIQYGWNPKSY